MASERNIPTHLVRPDSWHARAFKPIGTVPTLSGGEPHDPATNGDAIRALADDADRLPSPPPSAERNQSRQPMLLGPTDGSDERKAT